MKGESFARFRPSRSCANPNAPCIEVMMTRQMTDLTSLDDPTTRITIDDCSDSLWQNSGCLSNYKILQTVSLPLNPQANQLPYEFADDPWSVLMNADVVDELNSGRKSLVIIIKHLQREFSTVTVDTIGWHLNVLYLRNALCFVIT